MLLTIFILYEVRKNFIIDFLQSKFAKSILFLKGNGRSAAISLGNTQLIESKQMLKWRAKVQ